MNENRVKRNKLLGERIVKGLESRNMEGFYAQTKEEALKKALEWIPQESTVAWGGSMSIAEIGLKQAMIEGNYKAFDRDSAPEREAKREIELITYNCDYFLTSANAISEDGVIVNVDGFANRVSAIAAGPRNVIMVVGMNKVVRDVENAVSRARNEAAPINAQRFDINTPCSGTGVCFDCKSPDCICCQILITRFSKLPKRIKVILVNENLGF